MMNLYLGAASDEWDTLTQYAEDLLYSELPEGQCILGIYPFGDRIFGFEDKAPSIMCLYLRDLSTVLDPMKNYLANCRDYHTRVKKFTTNYSGSTITFFDLYNWVMEVKDGVFGDSDPMLHLVPSKSDVIYQDDSISDIVQSIANYLEKTYMSPSRFQSGGMNGVAHRRTIVLHQLTGVFEPCLNKDWTTPVRLHDLLDCPKDIEHQDDILINAVTNGEKLPDEYLKEYNNFLYREYMAKLRRSNEYQEQKDLREAGKRTENLLRRLL